jgi:hypothetical protein
MKFASKENARLRHIQNLCGFSTPTAMGQSFIMTLYYDAFQFHRVHNFMRPMCYRYLAVTTFTVDNRYSVSRHNGSF